METEHLPTHLRELIRRLLDGPQMLSAREAARVTGDSTRYWQTRADSLVERGAHRSEAGQWRFPATLIAELVEERWMKTYLAQPQKS